MKDQAAAVRKMLADAISLGTKLAHFDYAAPIQSEAASVVLSGIEDLRASTRRLLDSVSLQELSEREVFPLYEEIAHNLSKRSDACTPETK